MPTTRVCATARGCVTSEATTNDYRSLTRSPAQRITARHQLCSIVFLVVGIDIAVTGKAVNVNVDAVIVVVLVVVMVVVFRNR